MSDKPRIMINTLSVGSGAYLREMSILRALGDKYQDMNYHVLCSPTTVEELGGYDENVSLHVSNFIQNSMRRPAGTARRLIWDNLGIPFWTKKLDADVVYFPLQISNLVDFAPKIVAIRNIAPWFPEMQPARSKRETLRLNILRQATRRSISQAKRVICYTEATKDRLAKEYPKLEKKSVIIRHGVPHGFHPKQPKDTVINHFDLPDEFILSVSNIARYKNQIQLVKGYSLARQRTSIPPLYLVGKTVDESYSRELTNLVRDLDLEGSVNRLGYVEHSFLPDLYSASTGFVYSSGCENAPVTLIEAMACGAAIASSNATSMPEICGDAAVYFNPSSPKDIAEALLKLATKPSVRQDLSEKAICQADRYSWERAAQETHKVFRDVVRET